MLPNFAVKEGVVALGELGYDEQTSQEDRWLCHVAKWST